MPLLPNFFSYFLIILKRLIQLILIIYYSFPQLLFDLIPTHPNSCSFFLNKTNKQTITETAKENHKKAAMDSSLCWSTISKHGNCPGEWLIYPLSIRCRKLIFSISEQLPMANSFCFLGGGFRCHFFSVAGISLSWFVEVFLKLSSYVHWPCFIWNTLWL